MIKYKKEKSNPQTAPQPVKNTTPASVPASSQVQEPVQTPVKPNIIKVVPASIIKIRNSAPDSEALANRWKFFKTTVSLQRDEGQRVVVAGNAKGTEKWGVDNQLIIKGQMFEGLTGTIMQAGVWMPEDVKCAPLDITHLVPAGRPIRLTVDLVDNGRMWGNTDIYLVIK